MGDNGMLEAVENDRRLRLLERQLNRSRQALAITTDVQRSNSRLLESLMEEIEEARRRSDELLANILPKSAIDRLAKGAKTIADEVEEASVIFADFVGFTPISAELSALELVQMLNQFYSAFDDAALEHGVEKIKTIGDAYLAVAGLAGEKDHAERAVYFALAMQEAVAASPANKDQRWRIRVGVHSGTLTAGVIGKRKFAYDIWGDTVNIASRVQDACPALAVAISDKTASLLSKRFCTYDPRLVELKGRGEREIFLVRPSADVASDQV